MTMLTDPRAIRRTHAWKVLAADTIKRWPMCWLQLDRKCTLRSTTADHVIPIITAPHLAFEPANCRGACHHCNFVRQDTPASQLPALRRRLAEADAQRPSPPRRTRHDANHPSKHTHSPHQTGRRRTQPRLVARQHNPAPAMSFFATTATPGG